MQRQAYELRDRICTTTGVALKAFLALKHTNVLSLVSAPDATAFPARKTELVDRAVSYIKKTIHKLTAVQAIGRWYVELKEVVPGRFTIARRVVDEENFAKKMEMAYFTQEQVEKLRSLSVGKPWGFQAARVQVMYLRQEKHGWVIRDGKWKPSVLGRRLL